MKINALRDMLGILKSDLGGKNSSIFIDFVKEDQCRERPAQNMEIRPWKLRARKSSICIDFVKEIRGIRDMLRIWKSDLRG